MADLTKRLSINVPGRLYVDSSCLHCQACVDLAPSIFSATDYDPKLRRDVGRYCFVSKQPETAEEIAQAQNALESCPAGSIGDNGLG